LVVASMAAFSSTTSPAFAGQISASGPVGPPAELPATLSGTDGYISPIKPTEDFRQYPRLLQAPPRAVGKRVRAIINKKARAPKRSASRKGSSSVRAKAWSYRGYNSWTYYTTAYASSTWGHDYYWVYYTMYHSGTATNWILADLWKFASGSTFGGREQQYLVGVKYDRVYWYGPYYG